MKPTLTVLTAPPHRLLAPMLERIQSKYKQGVPALVLVPEQLTLLMERALMKHMQTQGFFDLDVLSPSRFSERVLDLVGKDNREPLGEAGQRMAMSQALEKLDKQLPYYGSLLQSRGFVEKLSTLMTDMKRGGLDAQSFQTYVQELESGIQKEKSEDLSKIFKAYQDLLKDRFSDGEDQLSYMATRLKESSYLSGKHLFVYGFDALPERTITLLSACAPLCESITVGLVCVFEEPLYQPILQGIARLKQRMEVLGISFVQKSIPFLPLEGAPMRRHLDEQLYAFSPKAYEGNEPAGICFYGGLSPFEEANTMTRILLSEIKKGTDIEKMAVVVPEENGYPFAIRAALTSAGIPFYSDDKMPAVTHGLVRFFLSALRTASEGYRNEDVMRMIKSGYTDLSFEEGCELENYAIAHGINLKRWITPFTRGAEEIKVRAEALRLRLITPILTMRAALVGAKSAEESVRACFTLLETVGAYEKLAQEEERLLALGYGARANQNRQIWQALLTLLEQVVRLGEGKKVPLKYIAKRFACGFSAISLASLPPASNMLQVGTLGHILASEMDIVFLMGMNDGILNRQTVGLLTEQERLKTQKETGCYLGLTDQNRSLLARIDVKQMVTLPRQMLYVSCAKTDPSGTALRPLSILHTLQQRLFPQMAHVEENRDDLPLSSLQALSSMGLHFETAKQSGWSMLWQERFGVLANSESTAQKLWKLCRGARLEETKALETNQATALFGDRVLSVSRLEQFANCPFKHFLSYGLRLQENKQWVIDPIDTGNFYHEALQRFSLLTMNDSSYPNWSDDHIEQMALEAMKPLEAEMQSGPMGDGKRNQARLMQAYQTIVRSAQNMTKQLAGGKFHLQETEASFGFGDDMPPLVLTLSDGREVMLQGRIDRIDRYDTQGGAYVRIIDYKSSKQNMEEERMWAGLQLQLLLYLDVCVKATKQGKPAGAFYFHVTNPLVKIETDEVEQVQQAICKQVQLQGVALADEAVIEASGNQALPQLYTKTGAVTYKGKTLDESQFHALLRHSETVASDLAEKLLSGHVDISPVQEQQKIACDHCAYHAICHFDPKRDEEHLRSVQDMDMPALQEALETEKGNETTKFL